MKNLVTDPKIEFLKKIDLKALWPRNGHIDSVGVKIQ